MQHSLPPDGPAVMEDQCQDLHLGSDGHIPATYQLQTASHMIQRNLLAFCWQRRYLPVLFDEGHQRLQKIISIITKPALTTLVKSGEQAVLSHDQSAHALLRMCTMVELIIFIAVRFIAVRFIPQSGIQAALSIQGSIVSSIINYTHLGIFPNSLCESSWEWSLYTTSSCFQATKLTLALVIKYTCIILVLESTHRRLAPSGLFWYLNNTLSQEVENFRCSR